MHTTAIIVAAGRGTRAGGGTPKQYRPLLGRAVIAHTVDPFRDHPGVDDIVVVIHPDDRELAQSAVQGAIFANGADSRTGSVRAGLNAVPQATTHVLIHDAARPCVSKGVIDRVLAPLQGGGSASAPALSVTDALWRVEDGTVAAPAPRDGLFRAQTPQGFDLRAIRAALEATETDAVDDVSIAASHGLDVVVVEGDEANLKITTAQDFERAEKILGAGLDIRTGNGFDVHRFAPGDQVTLCGVAIPHSARLDGHSDADVAMHAITDAIYGALAEGDIGRHFPPSDPQWKGAASDIFLHHAVGRVGARGYRIANIDCTIICEHPKIGPHATAMQDRLSDITGVPADRISVKATTTETLGFTGRGEGIATQATVTLVKS